MRKQRKQKKHWFTSLCATELYDNHLIIDVAHSHLEL